MSIDQEEVSNISQLILNFYNKGFNKNEENPLTNNKNLHKNLDNIYRKLFPKKTLALEKEKILKTTKNNPTENTINDMNFIQDKKMFDKIIKYKLLEIRKQITILKYIFALYKYNVITLCHESVDLDEAKTEICTEYIKILKTYINDYIMGEKVKNLKKILEEFKNLNNFLIEKSKSNKQIKK
jgi:23S rRNA U2552 (ribose-2'-O)-methylase RlmE/FtsJ